MNFIAKYWAKAGGVVAAVLIIFVLVSKDSMDIRSIALLNLAFLMLHQFEEYVYPGGFKSFFNSFIGGKNRLIRFPLSDTAIIAVNVFIGWGLYFLAVIIPDSILVSVTLITSFINGIVHTGALLRFRKYNPGFITGLFLFIPFSVYSAMQLSGNLQSSDWLIIIPSAILGTALIPFTIYLFRDKTNSI
jgi:hypothetical protein